MKSIKKLVIPFLVIVPILAVTVLTVYLDAYKKYGSPAVYRAEQERLLQARMDSIRMAQNILTPEAIGDSVLVNLGDQGRLFEENRTNMDHIGRLQATLDSLRSERTTIEEKEASVAVREETLRLEQDAVTEANITALAGIYDQMDIDRATPLIIEMNDTLAVRILTKMEEKNASELLANIAETDINKALRLNSLLVKMGVVRP